MAQKQILLNAVVIDCCFSSLLYMQGMLKIKKTEMGEAWEMRSAYNNLFRKT
jgi:hypothetical protein